MNARIRPVPREPVAPVQRPFVRAAGEGPPVLCLHAAASSSAQWRALMGRLAPRFRVLAADAYGAGASPHWPTGRSFTLHDEVALVAPVLEALEAPAVLVGHSYGAAAALVAASLHPSRVRALVLYEPTLFSLVDAEAPAPNEADGIRFVLARAGAALDAGDPFAAARTFVDYWAGTGTWQGMPPDRRDALARAIVDVRRWGHALFHEPTPLRAFATLDVPVCLMTGGRSPVASLAVARLLEGALARVGTVHFPHLGHMGPVTHADEVGAAIERAVQGLR